jgi:hypothetical protein
MHLSSPSLPTGRQAQEGVFRCEFNKNEVMIERVFSRGLQLMLNMEMEPIRDVSKRKTD